MGLIKIGQNRNKKSDADMEATALDTILKRRGHCTEQSKVMYAVLRMAGIEAFFVEPRLSVEYHLAKAKPEEKEKLKELTETPLLSHMASGVAVKIRDKNGKEGVWIIDVTAGLLEADYIQENPGQWEPHPYWELSLRHFFMADLANLGLDQTNHRRYKAAEQTFKTALDLGEDSSAYHAMGNYAFLLSIKAEQLSCRSKDKREVCEDLNKNIDRYSKGSVEINPNNPVFQFNRGLHLINEGNWGKGEEIILSLLQSVNADPRYILPYQKLRLAIHNTWKKFPGSFSSVWDAFLKQMETIGETHPLLKQVIEKDLEEMKSAKPSARKAIDLIEKLKRNLKLL